MFDWIRNGLAKLALKAATLTFAPEWMRAAFTSPTWNAVVREGYKKNSVVFACMAAIASAFTEPPLTEVESDEFDAEQVRHGLLAELLRKPNKDMGQDLFLKMSVTYAVLGGSVFFWKQRNRAGMPVALWPLHRGQVEPLPGRNTEDGYVRGYVLVTPEGRRIPIPKEDIIQWQWMVDPSQPWQGLSALSAAAREVDADNEGTRYMFALLKNDAVPRIVVTLVEGEEADAERIQRLKSQWRDRVGGDNAGVPAFLEAGMQVQRLGLNLQELAFDALKKVPEERICSNFRVPMPIAGLGQGASPKYSNYGEAREAFTEDTLVPMWKSLSDAIQHGLGEDYGHEVFLSFDLRQVRSLQKDVDRVWERATRAWEASAITRAEWKRQVGLETIGDEDEVYRVSLTTEFIGIDEQLDRPQLGGFGGGSGGGDDGESDGEDDGGEDGDGSGGSDGEEAGFRGGEAKLSRRAAAQLGSVQQQIRRTVSGRMEAALDGYFQALADKVVGRFVESSSASARGGESKSPACRMPGESENECVSRKIPELRDENPDWDDDRVTAAALSMCSEGCEDKSFGVPAESKASAEDLITPDDERELSELIRRFDREVIIASWEVTSLMLGVDVALDLGDPAVTAALASAGTRVRDITETTLSKLRETLKYGADAGWSIPRFVRGDPEAGVPGIRDVVAETYRGRASTIARTELGEAQNRTALGRFEANGVAEVVVLDDGFDDSHETCKWINGQTRTLEWTKEDHPDEGPLGVVNPLQHPNCVRAFAPKL